MKQQLSQKSVWLFFSSFVLRWFIVTVYLSFIGFIFLSKLASQSGALFFSDFFAWLWFVFVFITPIFLAVCYIWAKLSYQFYQYELTEDGFKKESGVIYKKYVTIPYDRIQNVDIYRGILARFLGLSDLQIQTAGYSAVTTRYGISAAGAEGRLPGLSMEIAEQLRDEVIRRSKKSRNQGL
jgi:uncharacterized membrane protein YdbT with pleckstrin-like domain